MTLQLQYSFKETSSDAKILKTYIFQNKALDTVCLKINVSCYFVTMLAYIPLSIHVESEKWFITLILDFQAATHFKLLCFARISGNPNYAI